MIFQTTQTDVRTLPFTRWRVVLVAGAGLNGLGFVALCLWVPPDSAWLWGALVAVGLYTAVCCMRAVAPRVDLERYTLWDTWWASVWVGRALATVAELALALLLGMYVATYSGSLVWLPVIIGPIAVAQLACWYGAATGNHWWHVVEESIWAGVALLLVGVHGWLWWTEQLPLVLSVVGGVLSLSYFLYMLACDIPLYYQRWRVSSPLDRRPFLAGVVDMWQRREVTHDWKDWQPEWVWMTGYFIGVPWLLMVVYLLLSAHVG